MDSVRAARLYVSNRPEDLPKADFERQIAAKKRTDSIYWRAAGRHGFRKVTYKSSAGGMEIPAYLFTPLSEARHARARRDGVGARRRARRLGHGHVARS